MGFLKKKKKAKSSNQNYTAVTETFTPMAQTGVSSNNVIAGLLGVPGGDQQGAANAFDQYKGLAGFAPALQTLQRGIIGGTAAKGLLNSGITDRALLKEGANLNSGMFGNFIQQLQGLTGNSLNAGSLLGNVGSGQIFEEPSTGSKILKGVGKIASIFSDRRTKKNIKEFARLEDGLGVYTFQYLGEDTPRIGVMADEVAEIRPWALGPEVGGFMTVNYHEL